MTANSDNLLSTEPGALTRSRLILVLIFVLFALPLLVAWLLNFTGDFTPTATTHHGTLIQPVQVVASEGLVDPQGNSIEANFFKGEWTLVYRHSGPCAEPCRRALYVMRQVRLAQGKNIDRIKRLLLVDATAVETGLQAVQDHYPGLVLARPSAPDSAQRVAAEFPLPGHLYLVDPLGNAMMAYPPAVDPRGIIKDLERLLRISYIG